MSDEFDWHPKPFSAGDMEGKGALKLLGKPSLPLIAVLVRETVQNSWDARLLDKSVDFTMHRRSLGAESVKLLRESVFANCGQGTDLKTVLKADTLDVLEVSDRGTSGLGGPVRNDRIYREGVQTDYVDFVLNIGAKQDKSMGGGTYGYGKTICYLASEVRTILIWTRAVVDGVMQSRLIASAFGEQFNLDGRRYTGRQWWGRLRDHVIEPLLDDVADSIGNALFDKPFNENETGTSVLIIRPNLSEKPDALMPGISTAVLWHLWPKLIPDIHGTLPMKITLKQDGETLLVPDPSEHDFLRGYVQSLNSVRAAQAGVMQTQDALISEEIRMRNPKVLLGHLAISKMPCFKPESSEDPMVPVTGVSSYIALMRNEAELVVTYLKQSAPPIDAVHFCGVFKPTSSVDPIFAQAEPPAHDSWEPAGMPDAKEKQHVSVALRELRSLWTRQTRPEAQNASSDGSVSLGLLSARLSDLVPSLAGTRAGPGQIAALKKKRRKKKRTARSAEGNSDKKNADSTNATRNRLVVAESGLAPGIGRDGLAYVQFDIQGEITGLGITAEIGVGYDGGTDTDAVDDYVRGIYFLPGHQLDALATQLQSAASNGPVMELFSDEQKQWTLAIVFDDKVAIDIALRSRQVRAS